MVLFGRVLQTRSKSSKKVAGETTSNSTLVSKLNPGRYFEAHDKYIPKKGGFKINNHCGCGRSLSGERSFSCQCHSLQGHNHVQPFC